MQDPLRGWFNSPSLTRRRGRGRQGFLWKVGSGPRASLELHTGTHMHAHSDTHRGGRWSAPHPMPEGSHTVRGTPRWVTRRMWHASLQRPKVRGCGYVCSVQAGTRGSKGQWREGKELGHLGPKLKVMVALRVAPVKGLPSVKKRTIWAHSGLGLHKPPKHYSERASEIAPRSLKNPKLYDISHSVAFSPNPFSFLLKKDNKQFLLGWGKRRVRTAELLQAAPAGGWGSFHWDESPESDLCWSWLCCAILDWPTRLSHCKFSENCPRFYSTAGKENQESRMERVIVKTTEAVLHLAPGEVPWILSRKVLLTSNHKNTNWDKNMFLSIQRDKYATYQCGLRMVRKLLVHHWRASECENSFQKAKGRFAEIKLTLYKNPTSRNMF